MCLSQPQPCLNRSKSIDPDIEAMGTTQTPIQPALSTPGFGMIKADPNTVSFSPDTPHRDDSAFFWSDNALSQKSAPNAPFTDAPWNKDEPETWPMVYLPYHQVPNTGRPTRFEDLTRYVHYNGAGAAALQMLLYEKLLVAETEAEKVAIEFEAYLHWPFNITHNGYWKEKSGMTEGEIEAWKEAKKKGKKAEAQGMAPS